MERTSNNITLYVAVLNYEYGAPKLNEDLLMSLFRPIGIIKSISIATEEHTESKKSFAYVTMASSRKGTTAIKQLNFKFITELKGRIIVKKASDYKNPKKSNLEGKKYHTIFI